MGKLIIDQMPLAQLQPVLFQSLLANCNCTVWNVCTLVFELIFTFLSDNFHILAMRKLLLDFIYSRMS